MKKAYLIALLPAVCFAEDINLTHDIWTMDFSREAMSDNPKISMKVQSLEPYELYGKSVRANLYIRCQDNTTDLYITYDGIYLHSNRLKVEYRLDQEKSVKTTWDVSTDYQGTFARNAIPVIKSMFDKDRMLVRVTPYSKSPMTSKFNISGLRESIEPLRKACKW